MLTNHNVQFLNPKFLLEKIGIKQNMKVADFGAGAGYMTFAAADLVGKDGLVYGLDVQKTVIEHLQTEIKRLKLANVQAIWTNLEKIGANPIKPLSLDIVLIVNTLYQSTKWGEILREALRALSVGGIILIVDWKSVSTAFGPSIDERVDIVKLKNLADNLGLNKINEFEAGPYHFGLVFRK